METQHNHRERVDFAVTNGRVVQLAHTWSFQVADQADLAEHVKAWGWTIRDARDYGGALLSPDTADLKVDKGVDVEVVYVGPRSVGCPMGSSASITSTGDDPARPTRNDWSASWSASVTR